MRTRICDLFGIEHPLFAFSYKKEVVAAVSRAGGMGVFGALQFTPEQLEAELCWIDEHVDGKPYGVDVVMPARYVGSDQGDIDKSALEGMLPAKHKQFVEDVLTRFNVPRLADGEAPESLLNWSDSGGRSQVAVSLQHPIRLIVNALGPPPKDVIDEAHAKGVKVAALVGTVPQAKKQVDAGVDVVVAVGTEAGGHTGEVSTMVLVPDIVDAIAPVPVLAAGGIGSGRQVAAALALGADGAWTGSIWLTVEESQMEPIVLEKLLKARATDTVRSRSMSGKPARLLRTAWTDAWEAEDCPGTLPMPLQFMVTAEALHRIHRASELPDSRARELVGSPVGQIVGRMNEVRSAGDVVRGLMREADEVIAKMSAKRGEKA